MSCFTRTSMTSFYQTTLGPKDGEKKASLDGTKLTCKNSIQVGEMHHSAPPRQSLGTRKSPTNRGASPRDLPPHALKKYGPQRSDDSGRATWAHVRYLVDAIGLQPPPQNRSLNLDARANHSVANDSAE